MTIESVVLESDIQRLQFAPALGGSVVAWECQSSREWIPVFRPWNHLSDDRYGLACFPLVPWSNRITHGGFEQDGIFHPIRTNRKEEPYPIHGDGWLQPWKVIDHTADRLKFMLESSRFDGNPYRYISTQEFILLPNGMSITLDVIHLGDKPLPYGLGLHPYFVRNAETRLRFSATGVWLSGDDPIPTVHTHDFPATWDYNESSLLEGPLIDNCYTGWDGEAVIDYPDRGYSVVMTSADCHGYSLLYRPPNQACFCLEPITHPIDAFHMPGRPGLVSLSAGQTLTLRANFLIRH